MTKIEDALPRRRAKRMRLSVSIPAYLARWTRELAARNGVTVSAVVELAVVRYRNDDEATMREEDGPDLRRMVRAHLGIEP